VPRINPISKQDREIAARIKEIRQSCKCTRAYLAHLIGVAPAVITRIELGRVPLKYALAHSIFYSLQINPQWAATGKGAPKGYVSLPSAADLNVSENELFSEVCSTHLSQLFKKTTADSESEITMRNHRGKNAAFWVEAMFRDIPDGYVAELQKHLEKSATDYFSKCPKEDPARIFQRRLWYKQFSKDYEQRVAREKKSHGNDYLTETATTSSISGVKDQWPALKRKLQEATAEPGLKSKLAEFLKVDLTRVSQWLTDAKSAREPGAEYALRMLYWVEHPELQK
jgi:transcriptional regulator with XRE-family HTH domain